LRNFGINCLADNLENYSKSDDRNEKLIRGLIVKDSNLRKNFAKFRSELAKIKQIIQVPPKLLKLTEILVKFFDNGGTSREQRVLGKGTELINNIFNIFHNFVSIKF
jgi:hypothetical protein